MLIGVSFEKKIPKNYSWVDKIKVESVKKWTGSPYFHSEFMIGDHWVSANTDGIRRSKLQPLTSQYDYIFIDAEIISSQYQKILNFIDGQMEAEYDWVGIYLSQFIRLGSNREDQWFCSELVVKLLQICLVEEVLGVQPHLVSPARLFHGLNNMVLAGDAIFVRGEEAKEYDYRAIRESCPFLL